ncbi:MAG: cob(I)yrinic acid a,c-diamide adenosyltransferase [Planctomycetota bacterium]|nr:cob(I)yrinic acid a,c-diamide adenosyltransferase [Planctomycetota bacterium]
MKIYTKTGDDGTTGLIGRERVSKSDARIECTGSVDELNACIGLAVIGAVAELGARLAVVQNELFVIGSQLGAAEPAARSGLPAFEESSISRLEMEIDSAEAELPPLRNFILPGGTETSARLHLARTVCRRAERVLVGFSHDRPVHHSILTYINRLSDWLFVQARWANHRQGVADVIWTR